MCGIPGIYIPIFTKQLCFWHCAISKTVQPNLMNYRSVERQNIYPTEDSDGILSQINPTEDSQLETQLSQPYDDSTILGDNTIIGGHLAGNSAAETDVQPQINSDF